MVTSYLSRWLAAGIAAAGVAVLPLVPAAAQDAIKVGAPRDRQPDYILGPCSPGPSGALMRGEVALDGLGANDDH